MSDYSRDDIDLATAAEQSSEVEENQEGDVETGEHHTAEDAALAALTAAVLFDASLEQWLGERDSTLVVVLHEQCLRLRRLVGAAEQAGSPE